MGEAVSSPSAVVNRSRSGVFGAYVSTGSLLGAGTVVMASMYQASSCSPTGVED
ncbi:Uncharacterised protein [Mycobacteroides abscessus subsp. abscessus]|nr:hypothetical protein [Mycobacteroides abscessus]SHX30486.1 Uncharacterised protein [Mycobacteroides abscessus subsp. abscessus]SKU20019.1 Uncharacterised protein [Mycobacteroides abscessus subsp. abscessus]SKV82738.1 Uncharacterised protein [Mycobacteroides abscessus subsp. abscessus]SKW87417.1 Uncharacterised protein [Mycobacteroides abscessus subsp. abscessus]